MITLHRLDGKEFVVNLHWIETVEATPDTVITLTNGHKYVVQEPVAAVVREAIRYERRVAGWPRFPGRPPAAHKEGQPEP
ncbi:MAG: flagellar FlbD family protein [Bacillota bacterium]|nr:flagellar FlbD family protein [Bacillota bacterium]